MFENSRTKFIRDFAQLILHYDNEREIMIKIEYKRMFYL